MFRGATSDRFAVFKRLRYARLVGLSTAQAALARPPLILATFVARLLLLPGKSLFACGLRARTLTVLAPVTKSFRWVVQECMQTKLPQTAG